MRNVGFGDLAGESGGARLNRRRALAAAVGGGVALSGLARFAAAAPGVGIVVSPEQLRPAYDHVIVGAGSAGCVLAHRLGRAGRRVLLIEAGGPAKLAAIADPPEWPGLQGSEVDWRYATTSQPGLGGRVVPCPRGKVVGGSSAINALAYQRGHPAAYDRWPAGWRHADLLPYFKRAETFSGGADAWRGGDGPLHVLSLADVSDRTPVASAFMEAAQELGFPVTPDLGGRSRRALGGTSSASRATAAMTPRPPISAPWRASRWTCWSARGCSAWWSRAGGALVSGLPEASYGPKVRSCSAPVPSTLRAC